MLTTAFSALKKIATIPFSRPFAKVLYHCIKLAFCHSLRFLAPRESSVGCCCPSLGLRQRSLALSSHPRPKDVCRFTTSIRPSSWSSWLLNYHNPTEVERIRHSLREYNHSKWGFVFYRCSYDDNRAWSHFMDILKERVHNCLVEDNGLDLADNLVWSVHDDRKIFHNASIDQIRNHFNTWVASEAAKDEQPEAVHFPATPRYQYCIQVDAASLDSVVRQAPQPPEWDLKGIGYVNLIDGLWEPSLEDQFELLFDVHHEEDEKKDAGLIRVGLDGLLPRIYGTLHHRAMWYSKCRYHNLQVWVE